MKSQSCFFLGALVTLGNPFTAATIAKPDSQPTQTQLRKAFPGNASSVFEEGQQMTVFSIDGSRHTPGTGTFSGYHILRQRVITDPKLKAELRAAINAAIANNNGLAADCFNPHHGLRVSQGNQSVDLVICFGCRRLLAVSRKQGSRSVITPDENTEALFNRVLR